MEGIKMEKFWKYFKRIVIGIVVTALVLLSSMFIFGKIGKASDRKKIEDYGEKVEVFGNNINMYITGEGEGKETIVLLPGYGTIAPKISFDPVIEKMKDDYRIVLVEPFGYGLSDQTDRERTTANMVEEIHMALQAKGIDDFIFMGHSIAGIYMLSYINTYPGEAKAFIGIDTSVPTQPMFSMDTKMLRMADKLGFLQLSMTPPFGKAPVPAFVPEKDVDQYVYFTRNTSLNDTLLNELENLPKIFDDAKGYSLPKDMPVYLFVQEFNDAIPTWQALHEEQANSVDTSRMMLIDGDHFLHFEHSELIVKETKAFLNEFVVKN